MNGKRAKRLRKDAVLITPDVSGASGIAKDYYQIVMEDGLPVNKKVGTVVNDEVKYPPTSQRAIYQLIKKIKQ